MESLYAGFAETELKYTGSLARDGWMLAAPRLLWTMSAMASASRSTPPPAAAMAMIRVNDKPFEALSVLVSDIKWMTPVMSCDSQLMFTFWPSLRR